MSNLNYGDGIDHFVYATSDLETGMDEIERLLGTSPVYGGKHVNFGTHNALVSFGNLTYLEIIAPDPNIVAPERGILFQERYNDNPGIITWVYRTEYIEDITKKALAAGLSLGTVRPGSRMGPDGTEITWKVTDPYAMPLQGIVPFLINWGNTSHPSLSVPLAGNLLSFRIEHPFPGEVRKAFELLNIGIEVSKADKPRIIAKITTKNGEVELD